MNPELILKVKNNLSTNYEYNGKENFNTVACGSYIL